ncbi:MAG: DNA polymerase IV [Candidatus Omnitrophota bacterium]
MQNFITLAGFPRAIVHIDGDAFFASCEQAREPRLKGRPVVTGRERGIISSASYEAKALGIKRGVSLRDAKKICPDVVILPSDYETYSIYSERMFGIIRRFTPCVEEFSIDEAFCDITGLRRVYRSNYKSIALTIKETIKKELDITVSAGLSLSKTLAKICSRYKKPDGFTAVEGYRLHEFLRGVPLEMVCGFGPNTVELLSKCGLRNTLDYAERPVEFAKKLLGKIGEELWHELRGRAVYRLSQKKKEKYLSISKSKTFMPPSGRKDLVRARLMRNLESACIKLRRHKLSAAEITVYLRTQDFSGAGLRARLNRHSSSTLDFTALSAGLFDRLFKESAAYRATGVILSDIVPEGVDKVTLFDDPLKVERLTSLSGAVDRINGRYGKHKIHVAASCLANGGGNLHERNEPAWRKKELLKGETARKRLALPLLKISVR